MASKEDLNGDTTLYTREKRAYVHLRSHCVFTLALRIFVFFSHCVFTLILCIFGFIMRWYEVSQACFSTVAILAQGIIAG